ncbi:serine/threonine-protein phosphatase 2A regulatory subunit B'' subunit beta [Cebus imitator]|uniref:serine/threonine-protein phosphatase 2A regulatory subunit B'' subunit beta n=1 Tax=Cebus imitator TaxID=2715852 RepID=UPI00189B5AAB|nr:serine/threonine-protein phosphatase 2A regulatory subunit B'' subunit beta [Cebus imitator]
MPPGKALQPVLKMKVDELFLCWLSEASTQRMLQDCLRRIKAPGRDQPATGDAEQPAAPPAAPRPSGLDPPGTPGPGPALPLGAACVPRNAPHARGTRRSAGTRVVQTLKQEPLPPATSQSIPTFYFPRGRPQDSVNVDAVISKIEGTFAQFPQERASMDDMGLVAKACGCPLYWKGPLFYGAGGERTGSVSVHKFVAMWRKILHNCHDDAAKFVHLLMSPGCNYLVQEDFVPFLQDVVNTHPGLSFLKEASEFHSRYITTVSTCGSSEPAGRGSCRRGRRFRGCTHAGLGHGGEGRACFRSGRRAWGSPEPQEEAAGTRPWGVSSEAPCSSPPHRVLWQNVALLEEEADINQLTEFFSYEHFYVIYCKFWELDTDHDLLIDAHDLARHNDHAISTKMIDRIFSGAVTRGRRVQKEGKISYADFVWFLISEEDKKTPTSIEYWFRCMDLDGDGALSMFELEYFYEEQCRRLDSMAIEALPFQDCLCQMLDLVKPRTEAGMAQGEGRSLDEDIPLGAVSLLQDSDSSSSELSDWEKYAAEEYDILVAEEAAGEPWEDGFEAELSPVEQKLSALRSPLAQRPFFEAPSPLGSVDLYEFACGDEDLQPL